MVLFFAGDYRHFGDAELVEDFEDIDDLAVVDGGVAADVDADVGVAGVFVGELLLESIEGGDGFFGEEEPPVLVHRDGDRLNLRRRGSALGTRKIDGNGVLNHREGDDEGNEQEPHDIHHGSKVHVAHRAQRRSGKSFSHIGG